MLTYNEHLPSAIYTLSLESFINCMYLFFFLISGLKSLESLIIPLTVKNSLLTLLSLQRDL